MDDGLDGEKETSQHRDRDETYQYGVLSQMYNMTILFDTYALGSFQSSTSVEYCR